MPFCSLDVVCTWQTCFLFLAVAMERGATSDTLDGCKQDCGSGPAFVSL